MTEYSRTFKIDDPMEYSAIRALRIKAAISKLEAAVGGEVLNDIRENGPATVSVSLTVDKGVELKAEVTRDE